MGLIATAALDRRGLSAFSQLREMRQRGLGRAGSSRSPYRPARAPWGELPFGRRIRRSRQRICRRRLHWGDLLVEARAKAADDARPSGYREECAGQRPRSERLDADRGGLWPRGCRDRARDRQADGADSNRWHDVAGNRRSSALRERLCWGLQRRRAQPPERSAGCPPRTAPAAPCRWSSPW